MQYLKTIRLSVFAAGLVALVAVGTSTNTKAAASSGNGNLTMRCYLAQIILDAGASEFYYNLTPREAQLQVRAIRQSGVAVQGSPFAVTYLYTATATGTQGHCFTY
jgi:hypothetical protein